MKAGDLVYFNERRPSHPNNPTVRVIAMLVSVQSVTRSNVKVWNVLRRDTGKLGVVHETGLMLLGKTP